MSVDPRAVVDAGAKLGTGVTVGPFSVIGAGVEIGDGTTIGPHVVIEGPTRIGRDNTIHSFSSLGIAPQDKKYAGEQTTLEIGDRNTIFQYCTISRGTPQDAGTTRIGNDNWIMAYVHIAHDCVVGDNVILANCATLAGHVHIDDWAILGGFAKMHQFCHVGTHAFCGMDCGVTRDVPPYVTVSGHPAEPHGINSEGLKRRGFTAAQIRTIKQAYRLLYRDGLKLDEARTRIEALAATHPELAPFVPFFVRATRSIVR
ncbi:MAG: acyl-ACP--UDP-N-acetylglucosamine O-acyltransferase [Xanthomonadaceae bacterium]|nr:acyl-ACP--UDP-N-acetylglucosamine O-acyltransferase [Xanthomonadaceae bacterium]